LLFIGSLVILFRFSPVLFVKKVSVLAPSISDIKNSIKIDKAVIEKQKEEYINTKKEKKIDDKKLEYEKMIQELKKEKEALKREKDEKQLTIDDAPKSIKIEKKESQNIENKKIEQDERNQEKRRELNEEFKNWQLPELNLLDNR
jgi:hypothetical protein